MYDWASHFKHLQSILMEFDLATTPRESSIVRYFEKGLKLSIKTEIDQDDTWLVNYKELIAKTVRAKAKAGL